MGGNYKHCQVLFSHTAQFQCIFLKLPIKTHLLLKSLSLKRNTQEGEKKKKKSGVQRPSHGYPASPSVFQQWQQMTTSKSEVFEPDL